MGCVQKTYRFLSRCPICNRWYNEHWKVVSHIRKTKDEKHQLFLEKQEKEVIRFYKKNNKCRYYIKDMLYKKRNIFSGVDYGKVMNVVEKHIKSDVLENIRRERISKTMKAVPKTPEHNKKLSEAVKKAWKDGKFHTEENIEARRKGYEKRPSIKGKNNPMYGKPSPKGSGRGKGGIRRDITHYVRSTWEANMCRICRYMNRKYFFEPDTFKVVVDGEDLTYTPDFYFPDKDFYYELKGHAKSSSNWTCKCNCCIKNRKKMEYAQKRYKIKVVLIGNDEYKKFKRRFKKHISNWER